MWFIHKTTYEDKVEKVEVEKCQKCNALMVKEDMQKVTFNCFGTYTQYFCSKCKPKYDKIIYFGSSGNHYYGEVEMTEDGEPVGYKKLKDN